MSMSQKLFYHSDYQVQESYWLLHSVQVTAKGVDSVFYLEAEGRQRKQDKGGVWKRGQYPRSLAKHSFDFGFILKWRIIKGFSLKNRIVSFCFMELFNMKESKAEAGRQN